MKRLGSGSPKDLTRKPRPKDATVCPGLPADNFFNELECGGYKRAQYSLCRSCQREANFRAAHANFRHQESVAKGLEEGR